MPEMLITVLITVLLVIELIHNLANFQVFPWPWGYPNSWMVVENT